MNRSMKYKYDTKFYFKGKPDTELTLEEWREVVDYFSRTAAEKHEEARKWREAFLGERKTLAMRLYDFFKGCK